MKKTTKNWITLAKYDLRTAEAMLKTRRYLYVIICCQQAIEKMLKGIIAERTDTIPPFTHNLVKLREMTFSLTEWVYEKVFLLT